MPMTLAEAVQRLDSGEYPYSEANAKKIRGSANKCRRLPAYNCPLEMIPVDGEAFRAKWAKTVANRDAPEGFKTFKQFSAWHSNVKSLIDHASGKRAERDRLRTRTDAWTELHRQAETLVQPRRKGCGIQSLDLIALTVLQSVAREHAVAPASLNASMIQLWLQNALTPGRRNALRKASRLLDCLHEFPDRVDPALLPGKIGELPQVTKHRVTPPLPGQVVDAVRAYLDELALGQRYLGLASRHRRKALSPRTIKSIKEQLDWYFTALAELGRLDLTGNQDMEDVMSIENILAAFEAEISGDFYWKPLAPATNKKNMSTVFRFARRFHPELRDTQTEFFEGAYFKGWDSMTPENETFCRRLVKSDARMRKFLNLPRQLFEDAQDLMNRFDTLSCGEKTRALKLSTAAAAAAVLMFVPLRADTLIKLEVYGPDATILLPDKSKKVHLCIHKTLMKNKKPMTAELGKRGRVDPREILTWWMTIARHRVTNRILAPDPHRLLGGVGYGYLAEAWRYATAQNDLYMTLHQVRHGIASILLNQPGSDVEVIAALLNNSPATVLRKYAFFDREAAIERSQNGLNDVNDALTKGTRR